MTGTDVLWIVIATAVAGVLRWLEYRFPPHHRREHDDHDDHDEGDHHA